MAPEQIEGRDVDARTDIFAFGVVLYEMVCGRRPFAGDSRASLMAAIVAAEPPLLSSLQPQAPASLERLILRCLAKDPEDRWQTARDLAAELRWIAEAGSGTTTAAPRHHAPAAPRRAVGRTRGRCADRRRCLRATVPSMWPRPVVAEYQPVTFRKGVVSSARFTPDGQSFVYSASWEGQPYAAFLGRPESADARDLQLNDARILSISRAGDMAVLFGPQNIQRAFGARTLARIPMAGGARRDVLTGVVDADWIPGTDALAVIRDPGGGRPWTVEFPAGTTVHEARAAWSLRVSPDGSRVAFFEGPLLFDSRAGGHGHGHRQDRAQVNRLAKDWTGYWTGVGAVGKRGLVHGDAARHNMRRTCVPSRSRESSEPCTARRIGSCCTTSPRTAGCCCLATPFASAWSASQPAETRERDLTWLLASAVMGLSPDGETVIFEDPLAATPPRNPPIFRREYGWCLRRSRSERGREPRCLQTGSGCSRCVRSGSGPLADRGRRDGQAPEGRRGAARRRTMARRLEAHCVHRRHRRQQAQSLCSGDPGRRSSCDYAGRSGPRRQGARCATTTPSSASVGDAVDALSDSGRRRPGRFRRSGSEISRFNGARMADTCMRSTAPRGPRPPAVDVFRVELATGGRVLWKTLVAVRPGGRRRHERNRGDHPGRTGVLLLLHATAWRPVRGRRAQVTSATG